MLGNSSLEIHEKFDSLEVQFNLKIPNPLEFLKIE